MRSCMIDWPVQEFQDSQQQYLLNTRQFETLINHQWQQQRTYNKRKRTKDLHELFSSQKILHKTVGNKCLPTKLIKGGSEPLSYMVIAPQVPQTSKTAGNSRPLIIHHCTTSTFKVSCLCSKPLPRSQGAQFTNSTTGSSHKHIISNLSPPNEPRIWINSNELMWQSHWWRHTHWLILRLTS